MNSAREILETAYQDSQKIEDSLSEKQIAWIQELVNHAENHKAVLTVVISSLCKKVENPEQDIRQHKVELPNGYSGRSYDFNYVTPFMQALFPRYAMAESGWLTRSIEQVHPFNFDFPGKIRSQTVKQVFLEILNDVEVNQADAYAYLKQIFAALIQLQKSQSVIQPILQDKSRFTVSKILELLQANLFEKYRGAGASRLPVIALYSIYQLMMDSPRYQTKQLLPLKSHTTSDTKSASLGDIELINPDGSFFEVIEVKSQKVITTAMLRLAYEKLKSHPLERFLLLTTAYPETTQSEEIAILSENIRQEHGCEVIINGVMPSLKYYLRLLNKPENFVDVYTTNLINDYEKGTDLKQVHIEKWLRLLD